MKSWLLHTASHSNRPVRFLTPGSLFLLLWVHCFYGSYSQKVFDFNANCQQAYQEIIQLKLGSGQKLINREKSQYPDNLIPYFLENYIDFFTLFFNEDPDEYKKRIGNLDKRLDLINTGPSTSPFYLFSKSVIHFQWAAIKVKFGHDWDAAWEFRRSFLQAKENLNKFPDFSPSLLYHGAMQVTVGTIPEGYRWLSNLLGMKGNIKAGMAKLQDFIGRNDKWSNLFRNEAIFYYLYLQFYIENDKEGVFQFISDKQMDLKNNHLFAYLATNLSINNQQSQFAENIIAGRNQSSEYLVTSIWDLEMGYAKLNHLEPDAPIFFERFLDSFKGKFYLKDVYQKLSWYYYLHGNTDKANYYRGEILKRGSMETEADKLANKEAMNNMWPNKLLLQARLLNDGGYHREALRLLFGKRYTDFVSAADQLEFTYRVGRLYDGEQRDDEAIVFYKQAIKLGEKRKEYFAARAAWQIGNIYEQKGARSEAITWYQRCLNMKDHDFKNSLDQRAKAGIERCKGE